MENLWLEFVPDLSTLRVYSRQPDLNIDQLTDRLLFTSGNDRIEFPISPDNPPYISSPESSAALSIVSIKLPHITVEDVNKFFTSSALVEDWSSVEGCLKCRSCNSPVESLNMSELTPCLLPSATWGFEDMRVCEECGPLVVGDIRSHRHEKKSRKNNLFIDGEKIFIQKEGSREVRCLQCDTVLGTCQLSPQSVERLKSVAKAEDMIEFEKSNLAGPVFLTAYNKPVEETESLLQFIEDENESKKLPEKFNSKYFRVLSHSINELIVIPASSQIPVWGIRIMYHDDTLNEFSASFKNQLCLFAVPSPLRKNWSSTVLAPISPQILEL